jgi:copper(I)-binding protein
MNVHASLVGLLLLGLSSAAVADVPACTPTIEQAWIRAAPPSATALAGYALVRNPCASAVAITDASSDDFIMGMIHETTLEGGVSRMRHVKSVPVPARGEVRFAPGGLHLMLMHPRRVLKVGSKSWVVLVLADGRRVSAEFTVRKSD